MFNSQFLEQTRNLNHTWCIYDYSIVSKPKLVVETCSSDNSMNLVITVFSDKERDNNFIVTLSGCITSALIVRNSCQVDFDSLNLLGDEAFHLAKQLLADKAWFIEYV